MKLLSLSNGFKKINYKTLKPFNNFLKSNQELLLIVFLLLISGVSHAYNMFHFPYYENDEGTYMSQAWSLLAHGQLEPYTYWYDHAPMGWVFIALWTSLTGGFFTFGVSVNSGRVFMLLLHLAATFFLFKITKKISGKTLVATIAVLFFALSPLGIYYQRRVLLDNIMTFWSLFSLFLLVNTPSKLKYCVLSALAFGIAVLSKENAVFFIPAFLYIIFTKFHRHHRVFAFVQWLTITGAIISLYFIYALLRNEFFPVGFLGNMTPHVSLITTLQEQVGRGANLPFWDTKSDFYTSLQTWLSKDSFIIYAGALSSLITIIMSWKIKAFRVPALMIGFFWLFLLRGKLVIDFYILPLLPLLGITIGLIAEYTLEKITLKAKYLYVPLAIVLCLGIGVYYYFHQNGQYTHDGTTPQIKAVNWIKNNLPANANIIIDDYMYVDLHAQRFPDDKIFPNADWAWKIEDDPAIKLSQQDSNWTKTVYIALSHEITKQIKSGSFPFIKKAINNATLLEDWHSGYAFRNIPQFISTDGDWMSIYKIKDQAAIMLNNAWNYDKTHFIHSYGQVIDPQKNTTTSEGQAQTMLQAVWSGDKTTFDGVWAWTHDHFQYRTQDTLFSQKFVKRGNTYVMGDTTSASNGDEDIAMALLFAYNKWHDPKYLKAAKPIISDIWAKEVVKINDTYYLISGTNIQPADGYLISPSYLSPATYAMFAKIDTTDPWTQLSSDSYTLLNRLTEDNNQLPPNWILIERETGAIADAKPYVSDEFANNYANDTTNLFWRVGLDAQLDKSKNAVTYLNRYKSFFEKNYQKNDYAAIFDLSVTDPTVAKNVYQKEIDSKSNIQNGYWSDKTNYADQNWSWFATYYLWTNETNL